VLYALLRLGVQAARVRDRVIVRREEMSFLRKECFSYASGSSHSSVTADERPALRWV